MRDRVEPTLDGRKGRAASVPAGTLMVFELGVVPVEAKAGARVEWPPGLLILTVGDVRSPASFAANEGHPPDKPGCSPVEALRAVV